MDSGQVIQLIILLLSLSSWEILEIYIHVQWIQQYFLRIIEEENEYKTILKENSAEFVKKKLTFSTMLQNDHDISFTNIQ